MRKQQLYRHAQRCLDGMVGSTQTGAPYRLRQIKYQKAEAALQHIFLAQRPGDSFVLKFSSSEHGSADFNREVESLGNASQLLAAHPRHSAPSLRHTDAAAKFFTMEVAAGITAQQALKSAKTPQESAKIFAQAGAWLKSLHQGYGLQSEVFRPKIRLKKLNTAIERQLRKGRQPDNLAVLYRHIDWLKTHMLNGFTQDCAKTIVHGDYHAGNLFIDGDRVTGIDFHYSGYRWAELDIARFLVLSDLAEPSRGQKISAYGIVEAHQSAFFAAYGLKDGKDHPIGFFIRTALLREWQGNHPGPLQFRQRAVLKRLQRRAALACV